MSDPTVRPSRDNLGRPEGAVWVFYLLFVIFFALEGAFVGVLSLIGQKLGLGNESIAFTLVLFGITMRASGLITLRYTDPDRALRDPLNRAGHWAWRRGGLPGLFLYGVVLVGPPGVAIVLKKIHSPHARPLVILTAVIFTLLWVPLYQYGIIDELIRLA